MGRAKRPRPVWLLLCAVVSAVCAKETEIKLHPQGARPKGTWPITTGVPFKQGDLTDPNAVRILAADGKEIPTQVRQTARWPDESTKRLLPDFDAALAGEPTTYPAALCVSAGRAMCGTHRWAGPLTG